MDKPLVSIIIPSYNARTYILDAVRSALAQTHPRCEIIVVDDGSTDDTRALLEPYVRDQKIRYVHQENRGLSGARNSGIREAHGEYIALLDADDLFRENKVERAVAFLAAHPTCDICYNDAYHFWDGHPDELFKLDYAYYSGDDVLPNLIGGAYFIAPSTTVFRRSVFERFGYFDETLRRSEDLEFFLRATFRGCRVCFFPEILGKICLKPSGLQSFKSQSAMKVAALEVYERLNASMDDAARRKYRMRRYLVIHRLRAGLACLSNGERAGAREFMLLAFEGYRGGALSGRLLWFLLSFLPMRFIGWAIFRYQQARLNRIYKKLGNINGQGQFVGSILTSYDVSARRAGYRHIEPMKASTNHLLPKVHLGCGETYLKGYHNVDFPQAEHTTVAIRADQYADIRTLDYAPESVSEVRAHHLFEHFTRAQALALLFRWRRWLAPGGFLVLETPDAEGIMRDFMKTKNLTEKLVLERHLFGSEEAAWAIHYDGWFEEKYRFVLSSAGFEVVSVIRFSNNLAKPLNYSGTALVDALVRLIPSGVRDAVGVNTLPNILCVARKLDNAVDETSAAQEILSRYLVSREQRDGAMFQVWLKEFEQAKLNTARTTIL